MSDFLKSLNIEDDAKTNEFVWAELIPPNGNISSEIRDWEYNVNQDRRLPKWYKKDSKRYEIEFRYNVKNNIEKRAIRICNLLWTTTEKEGYTYCFLYGTLFDSTFGKNNNFTESEVLKKLREHKLAVELKKKFGDKLISITTDISSLGGMISNDILSIPTSGMYEEFDIPPIGESYWAPLSNQAHIGTETSCIRPFFLCGDAVDDRVYCQFIGGVRPFFILKSY